MANLPIGSFSLSSFTKSIALPQGAAVAALVQGAAEGRVAVNKTEDGGYNYVVSDVSAVAAPKVGKPRGQSEKNRLREMKAADAFTELLIKNGKVTSKSFFEVVNETEIPYRDFLWVGRKAVARGECAEVKMGRLIAFTALGVASEVEAPAPVNESTEVEVSEIGA